MGYALKSQQSLMGLAMFYCSKREASRAWLGKYLQRKCHEQKLEKSISNEWISNVLDACEKSKAVDDHRYAAMLIQEYSRRGKGKRYIEQKLREKGIHKDLWELSKDEDAEYLRAVTLAQKIITGLKSKVSRKAERKSHQLQKSDRYRASNEKFELKQKMLQKLISSGFSIDISRKATEQVLSS